MCCAASEANSAAMPFRSSSPPRRRSGASAITRSAIFSSVAWVIFDGKKPGQIALTVMPNWPHSPASARVKFTTPPLVVL